MKTKLLMILGAGSSIGRGMPSVPTLDRHLKQWAQDWAASYGFPDYYDELLRAIATYYQSGKLGLRPTLNFEKVLGEMVSLSHWMMPAPWGDTLRQIACDGAPPPHLLFPNPSVYGPGPYGPTVMVMDQLEHLLVDLASHVRAASRNLDLFPAALSRSRTRYSRSGRHSSIATTSSATHHGQVLDRGVQGSSGHVVGETVQRAAAAIHRLL